MRILVTGATGLIGQKLCKELLLKNHELVVVGRSSELEFRNEFTLPCEYFTWNNLDASNIQGVFHLAGDSIASGRWTLKKKNAILNSRIQTTEVLVKAFTGKWPEFFVGASAVGYYGNRADELLMENSPSGNGFLSEVCKKWELASMPFEPHSRLVHLRLGLVLDNNGGFLEPMERVFSLGLGGVIGTGNQRMSWIHSRDLILLFLYTLEHPLRGVFNAVAPEPITNAQWVRTYARQLGVRTFMPTPGILLKVIMGEMSQLATDSQNVSSEKIRSNGFKFIFSDIKSALADLYKWKTRPFENLFESDQWISAKREDIFPFFSDAKNLEQITPPWLKFRVLKQSTENIQSGTLIDYKISLKGIPMKWRTAIRNWNPPYFFSDDQIRGPYKKWFHIHSFYQFPKGTLMKDQVIYELPLGRLGQFIAGKYIKNDISRIFSYRKQMIKK
ncbi:MAG: TIGR01777 family protein [Bdellovibrionaceae bacterium]|nr:TIGR01777 family protein [Pseudobdellovibrionaceae bacterium]